MRNLNVEEIKKEIDALMQKISLGWDGLSKKEKKDLLFIASRFEQSMIAHTIFDDESFKVLENEKDN